MLGQTSQVFAEAEMAYRHNRVIEDYAATQATHPLRWLSRLSQGRRRPSRPALPATRHAISH